MANCKLTIILSAFVFCYMATTTTKIVSFEFCMEVNGQLGCYDMYSGRTGAEFPSNGNFFGVKLNELANPNFQSVHYGGFLFSISLNVSYLQIVNVTSREQKSYELNFHPLALRISHNSPDNFHLYVIGVNLTGKCDEQSKLIFHYVTFSINNCHDNERWPCPSSYYKLLTAKNCSEQIPLIALSPDVNYNMVLLFKKSASDSLFCYSLSSYDQCVYPLGHLPQDYTIVAYHPYHGDNIIFQIKYDDSKYKCYSFGYDVYGFNELSNECPPHAKMVTPLTFRSAVSGASILYRNETAPEGFEELNDVIGDPVEIENGSGLVYVSGIAELTVNGPGLFGGKQTLTTQDPICKDAHNNALLLAMSENDHQKQLTVLLCPKNQSRYLQGFIRANGTYSPIPIHEKSVIKSSGPISLFFFPGIVKHEVMPGHTNSDTPPSAAPFQMKLLIPIVIFMIFLVVVVISGTVFACYWSFKRHRNHHQRTLSQGGISNEYLLRDTESQSCQTHRSSPTNLISNEHGDIEVLVNRENDECTDVVQTSLSDNVLTSLPPLGQEERGNGSMSDSVNESSGKTSTQQMTVKSSYNMESHEPDRDSGEPVQAIPKNGVEATIVAPPNESSSHQRKLVGSEHEDQLQSTAVNTPSTHESSGKTSTQQMTVKSSYNMESHEPDRDSGEPVKHVQEPASTQCPTIQVILKNGVEATIVAPPNESSSHQRKLVGSEHEGQLQSTTVNTPITQGDENLHTSEQEVEVGGVSHFEGLVVSGNLPLTFPSREGVNVGSDDGSSDEYTRELREGAEGYC